MHALIALRVGGLRPGHARRGCALWPRRLRAVACGVASWCAAVLTWTMLSIPATAADAMPPQLPALAHCEEAAQPGEASTTCPRIGVVLSGGGARGGAHIGVLKVLEALQVPVDVVVGTSAGAIVGAAYASGLSLDELEREMSQLTAGALFRDARREDLTFRRKVEEATNYIGPEFGVNREGLQFPRAAVSGVALEAVLRRLTRRQQDPDFDRLAIPFRAVATDLTSGEMVILREGSLAQAVRASMAIPGAVNPVEIGERLLVDGGLKRNLPVDVARALGAQVIIAVNIGTPLQSREELNSLFAVSNQMINILTEANVQASLAELGPQDILISPDLGNLSSADFNRLSEAARLGEVAAQDVAHRLQALSLTQAAYARRMAGRLPQADPADRSIDRIEVAGLQRVHPQHVTEAMRTREGDTFDAARVDADMRRIFGRGDFDSVSYSLVEDDDERVLLVQTAEKPWGPHYLRFGLNLSSDFGGNAFFNVLASQRSTWLNAWGGEWRNEAQLGRTDRFSSQWFQPLHPTQRLFVAPQVLHLRELIDIYTEDNRRLTTFRRIESRAELDLGGRLGPAGEWRVGLSRGRVRIGDLSDTSSLTGLSLPNVTTGGVRASLAVDELDSLRVPRSGYAGRLDLYTSLPGLGADERYTRWEANWRSALAVRAHSLRLDLSAGGRVGDRPLPGYEQFVLGGFLRLSGYRTGQLYGNRYELGRLIYTYRLTGPTLFDGVSVGGSLEAGRIGESVFGDASDRRRRSQSLFVAADTPLGPVYLAYGWADRNNDAVYLFLGVPP